MHPALADQARSTSTVTDALREPRLLQQIAQRVGVRVRLGDWTGTEAQFDGLQDGAEIIRRVVDEPASHGWPDCDERNANARSPPVAARRCYMVPLTAVFVVGDDN